MKKSISLIAMTLGSVICLNSCNDKESLAPSHGNEGVPFEIAAGFQDTKTVNDGMETKWASGDAINLFHASAGTTTYVDDKQFTLDATRDGVFTGTLAGELTEGAYDWYAFYPYGSYNTTPASKNQGFNNVGANSMTQDGNDSKAHLSGKYCPLYGVTKSVSNDVMPTMVMNNLTSVIAVLVKNTTDAPLQVTNVSFTSTEDIVGTYYIDFTGDEVVYTPSGDKYVYSTASLAVTNGEELASNESATFYIPVKPHTAASGAALKLSVNGYEKSITLTKDITFTAGKIKTLNFNFDKVVIDYVTLPWSEDFSGDMSLYSLNQSGTKIYKENLAGGESPELLVAKNNGSISVKIKASVGKYDLSFKSNYPAQLNVSCDNANVQISKVDDTLYSVLIVDGIDFFTLTIKNTSSSKNARLDDILMTLAPTSIKADDEVKVSARAESAGDLNYTVLNPTTETMVATCDGTVVTDVTAGDGTCLYATSDNVSALPREGWIKLTYGSVEKIIKVTQAAPVFTLSSSEVILGAEDNATATITVTSDFDWVSDISYGSDESLFVIDPSVCNWTDDDAWKAASGETMVSVIAEANTSTSERTLGTVTFADVKTAATQTVTIKQRGAGDAPVVSKTVTLGPDWNSLFKTSYTGQFTGIKANSWSVSGIQEDVSISVSNGTFLNGYLKTSDFRVYSGYTIILSVPSGMTITKLTSAKGGKTFTTGIEANAGELKISNNSFTWEGSLETVKLDITGTVSFATISVTYE